MNTIFKEVQRFKQWWLWSLLVGITLIPLIGIYQQIIMGKPFGNKPMSDAGLIVFAFIMLLFLYWFYSLKLTTRIDEKGIYFYFFPLVKRSYAWNEVANAEVVRYGYVGWGIRFGSKYGTVYNTQGREGLAVELKNGKKFVIGSAKSKELQLVVEHYQNS